MSDDTFTMADAENDGLIKREVGGEMERVARRDSKKLFELFEQVCDHEGREPWKVLGDGVVRALNDETVAESIAAVDIDMSKVETNQTRLEDAKFVKELSSELGLDESGSNWIEDTVRERIRSKTESPIPQLDGQVQQSADADVRQELEQVKSQMNELMGAIKDEPQSSSSEGKDVDELFEGVADNEGGDDGPTETSDGGGEDSDGGEATSEASDEGGDGPDLENLQVDIAEDVDSRGVEGPQENELPSSTDGQQGDDS